MKNILKIIAIVVIAVGVTIGLQYTYKQINIDKGKQAVMDLYNFENLTELAKNMNNFKKLCTDDVYKELTPENADRALNVYLKEHKDKTVVHILEANDGEIIYTLDNPNLPKGRVFTFKYKLNFGLKISEVKEAEMYMFRQDYHDKIYSGDYNALSN